MSTVTIDEATALIRQFGDIEVRPDLTVSDIALIVGALRCVTAHPSVADSDVVLNRVFEIIDRIRVATNEVDESLDVLFQNVIHFAED
jgi:hypothetical protein